MFAPFFCCCSTYLTIQGVYTRGMSQCSRHALLMKHNTKHSIEAVKEDQNWENVVLPFYAIESVPLNGIVTIEPFRYKPTNHHIYLFNLTFDLCLGNECNF